jgi:DNA-binding transcriptional MerR regulator
MITYPPQQAAAKLRIATSTLRKYSQLYTQHLSKQVRHQHRHYTDSDIAILGKICELRSEGASLAEIDQLINNPESGIFSFTTATPVSSSEAVDQPSFSQGNENIRLNNALEFQDLTEKSEQQQAEIFLLSEKLEQITTELLRLHETIKQLEDLRSASTDEDKKPIELVDFQIEFKQFRAEIYRFRENQKRLESRLDEFEERISAPWWKKPQKKP